MNWTRPSGTSGTPFSIAAHPIHHACLTKAHEGPPCTPTLARAVPMNSRHRGAAVTHGGGRRVLLSCQRNWTRVTVSRKNPPLPACSVAQNHPTVMRAGTVIPPKIPSSSSESQFSRMLAPGLAVGLSTGQADCPADGRLRRRARRTLLGPSSARSLSNCRCATRSGSPRLQRAARRKLVLTAADDGIGPPATPGTGNGLAQREPV